MAIDFDSNWIPTLSRIYSLLILLAYWQLVGQHQKTQTKLQQLNKKVELLLQHFQIQPDNHALLSECRELKNNQGVIAAIKHYRTQSGVGLKEAKDAMDTL